MHLTQGRIATFLRLAGEPGVRRFLLEGMSFNLSEAKRFIRDSERLKLRTGLGLYLVLEDQTVIGYAGFIPARADKSRPEIIYALADGLSGRGRGTRVCTALVQLAATSGLEELLTVVNPENIASVRVLERNGFFDFGPAPGDLSHLRQYGIRL